jgi:hypothetical protein
VPQHQFQAGALTQQLALLLEDVHHAAADVPQPSSAMPNVVLAMLLATLNGGRISRKRRRYRPQLRGLTACAVTRTIAALLSANHVCDRQ